MKFRYLNIFISAALAITLIFTSVLLSGCDEKDENTDLVENTQLNTETESTESSDETSKENESSTAPDVPLEPIKVTIEFNGKEYAASKKGCVEANGNVLTIVQQGLYELKGNLENAQIRVCVDKTEKVDFIFAGINITNKSNSPFYIESADKVSIELKSGTENTLTDCMTYIFPAGTDKPNACLYSSEDLTIKGEGSLTVNAYYNNGIGCKNDLKIKGGNIKVSAPNNAVKGVQSVKVESGNLNLQAADGIKADSLLQGEGIVEILGGNINIKAADDGLQAVTSITVKTGATVTINAADKHVNCDGTTLIDEGTIIRK